jgi:MoxR-like ATPase
VLPDDVRSLAVPVLSHRLLVSARGRSTRKDPTAVVAEVLAQTVAPGARG